jgi:hypothetical protein
VVRRRREVDEVPLPERPPLLLDNQKRLAREHEEGFLLGLPVVHRVRDARLDDGQVDAGWGKYVSASNSVFPVKLTLCRPER